MPELPEVETVKRVLEKVVIGRTITKIDVLRKSAIQGDEKDFVKSVIGEKYLSMSRVGKFLIFHLTNDKVIISHLRMEGKYYELDEKDTNTKYSRVVIHLDNNKKLCYDDSRCFGYMKLSNESEYLKDKEIAKLGPEPWDADVKTIMGQVKRSSLPIKSALLSQELVTGLGNIYVDETLYASHIHPLTPANKVNEEEWKTIIKEASRILKEAIVSGGSTIKSYHPGKDIDGNFQSRLLAYGKKDTKCPVCGATFRFIKVNGRGTTFCPHCQPLKSKLLKVAIFGKIASGKSEALKVFSQNNIPTLSADAIVNELYQRKDVIDLINKEFNLGDNVIINREALREQLSKSQKEVRRINKIVHPLVKQETELFFSKHKTGIVAMEVPLLFESKMDKMFDVIIAIETPKEKQLKLLNEREGAKAIQLENINKSSTYDENKNKADFVIVNDKSLAIFDNKVQELINKLKLRLD